MAIRWVNRWHKGFNRLWLVFSVIVAAIPFVVEFQWSFSRAFWVTLGTLIITLSNLSVIHKVTQMSYPCEKRDLSTKMLI